jgi:16S rRNA (cytosine967-C5)-methyltransferase
LPISPARSAAFEILRLVEGGGYASNLLMARTTAFDSRDAGLASEIVFGVLRYRAQLDFLIEHYSGRHAKLDPEVRIALRMAIYQLRYLERVPAHAAVMESVELVKRARLVSAAGFVNAILRQVNRDPVEWPSREVRLSCPEWLLSRWVRFYGTEVAEGIANAALHAPEAYTQLETGRTQDIGSQAIVPLLRLEPGQWFLDLCAAPGNKTAQALAAAPGIHVIACDRYIARLAGMSNLGMPLVVLDGAEALPFSRKFDRILVDAPCSGTGTLGRNPEIKWRLTPADLPDFAHRQSALLASARRLLAPRGRLVYSTCSLEPEENQGVLSRIPAGLVEPGLERLPGRDAGDGFWAAVIKSG